MISTKGRYALKVMVELAEHDAEEYIPLKGIAEKLNISQKYLESISVLPPACPAQSAVLIYHHNK